MSEESRSRFAEVVRARPVDLGLACLLVAAEADPTVDVDAGLAQLDALAAHVDPDSPPVAALRSVLGGFTGDAGDYRRLESSLLHEVLRRRSGLPILLSVVWLEVARRRGIEAAGIGLPGHFVVRVAGEYLDPFSGGAALPAAVLARVDPAALEPAPPEAILLRILANIRAWADGSPERGRVRLWAVELSLLLPRHPLELRRERGVLLVSLGDFLGGAAELDAYAEAVEPASAEAAEAARRQARLARSRLN